MSKKIKYVLAFSMLVTLVSFCIALYKCTPNADAYYYVGVSRLILEGQVPFVDFSLGYTPLSFYMMSLPTWLCNAYFPVMLTCIFALHLVNALLIVKLIKKYTSDRFMLVLAAAYYLVACFILEGKIYVLEPFVTFWGLLCLMNIEKGGYRRIFYAGIFAFSSMYCKQYGFGYVGLAVVYLLLVNKTKKTAISQSAILLGGVAIALCAAGLFFVCNGWHSERIVNKVSGSGYAMYGITSLLKSYVSLVAAVPALVIAAYAYLKDFRLLKYKALIHISLLGIFGFMLASYVRPYWHYIQLALPMAILFVILVSLHSKMIKESTVCKKLLVCSIIIPTLLAVAVDVRMFIKDYKTEANFNSGQLLTVIPEGTKNVYVDAELLGVAYLNNYMPPLLKKYGMSNGFVEDEMKRSDLISAAKYCIIRDETYNRMLKVNPSMKEYMELNFVDITEKTKISKNSFTVYERRQDVTIRR